MLVQMLAFFYWKRLELIINIESKFSIFKYVGLVASLLQHFFSDGNGDFLRGNALELESKKELLEALDVTTIPGGLKYVIHTCPGEGPEVLGEHEALLDKNGMPNKFAV